ncbi:spermatogenesis-associated serine-rich protein 1 isoform X2 [Ochotona princeps]|uniref:spermatogenesis-associated serine-rich protein 1 isoform X2 n=1 Tax=Ochotona princeps TaxID=9978 RepID=UPI002714743B|nr:spermatogenesis-associated serine-rich protein 1 isoform X2 [Ochotona princeps]
MSPARSGRRRAPRTPHPPSPELVSRQPPNASWQQRRLAGAAGWLWLSAPGIRAPGSGALTRAWPLDITWGPKRAEGSFCLCLHCFQRFTATRAEMTPRSLETSHGAASSSCGGELEKIPEYRDADNTKEKRRYSANHGDFLQLKESHSSTPSSGRKAGPSSCVEADLSGSEPPSLRRVVAHLNIAAALDGKSSSSLSDHSSEVSLSEGQQDNPPEELSLLKLQTKDGQRPEWTFYPRLSSNIHTYHVGKQCRFNGVFLGNRRSCSERRVDKCLGRKKYDIDSRNGIPKLTPGDNPYMYPEQSKDFHKAGSTLPPVNFSIVPYVKKFDTFIPLEPLPQFPNLPFCVKEKANNLKNEITEVEELDNWQPAVSLVHSVFPSVPTSDTLHQAFTTAR